MNIAVIPARGGSKRIPRKNIKEFLGAPAISYAISAAIKSELFSVVLVSTDDEEIAAVSSKYGAKIIKRPSHLSDDFAPTVPVIRHAIQEFEGHGSTVDEICCIYPVTPLLTTFALIEGYRALQREQNKFVFPIVKLPISPARALKVNEQNWTTNFDPSAFEKRTQDLEEGFMDAGQFYWATRETWMKVSDVHQNGLGLPCKKWTYIDVDDPEDWDIAELLYKKRSALM